MYGISIEGNLCFYFISIKKSRQSGIKVKGVQIQHPHSVKEIRWSKCDLFLAIEELVRQLCLITFVALASVSETWSVSLFLFFRMKTPWKRFIFWFHFGFSVGLDAVSISPFRVIASFFFFLI